MFSKKITETDLFLDMSMSAQCLYFHINMSADDDGFVGNVKTIRRMIGASEDDLKILMAKEFIIPFDSGVVVVKDWKIHNYIRKDRYDETIYKKEKQALIENKESQYELGMTSGQPNDDQWLPQGRLGKVRLGEVRLGKDNNNNREDAVDDNSKINAQTFYQENFGVASPIIIQSIDMWIDDLNEELVIEAMRRAALNESGFKYAEGIMKNWDRKGFETIEEIKASDVSFENKKNKPKYNGQPSRKETLPEWAQEGYVPPESKGSSWTQEDEEAFKREVLGED